MKHSQIRKLLLGGAAVATVLAATVASLSYAQWQGPQGPQGPNSGQGQGQDGGHDDGGDHDDGGGHSGGDGHSDEGTDGGEHDSLGGQGGSQGQGGNGGSPVWAKEGIPEVELGRLSVVRSPTSVLDRAFAEVISTFDPSKMEGLYELSAAQFAAEAAANWDGITIIDSPLQNLSLLRELWTTGRTSLPGVQPFSTTDLSGILLGVASDKEIPISVATVQALAIIMKVEMSDASARSIAEKAEAVRRGVALGHG